MMKKITISLLLVLFSLGAWAVTKEFSVTKGKQVDQTLRRIAKKSRKSPFLRKVTFSQESLNAYLNLFYTKRYAPEVKYIKIDLAKDNHASGTMKVVLKGKKYDKVPAFLRDIEVEFAGKVMCEKYRMRYSFDTLKINGSSISPALLDEAFGTAQAGRKVKKSMYDWFELMPGIKEVVIDVKKITLFY